MCSCVEPCKAPFQGFHLQLLVLQETLVNRGDFQFSTCRRLNAFGNLHHLIRIEVQTYNRIIGLRMSRFFLYGKAIAVLVKLCHAIAFRVTHPIAKHGGFSFVFCSIYRICKHGYKSITMEDVIAEHQTDSVITNKFLTNQESLCQPIRRRLFGIGKLHSEIRSIA